MLLIKVITEHRDKGTKKVLAAIQRLGEQMGVLEDKINELNSTISAAVGRITEDVDHLRSLVTDALATQTADQAEIARLNAEADAAVTSINDAIAGIGSIDPDPSFPAAEPPVEPNP